MNVLALGFVCGCGAPEVQLPEALWVEVLPPHGADDIAVDVQLLAYFSHPLAEPATLAQAVSLTCRGAPPCGNPDPATCPSEDVVVITTYDPANQVARIAPVDLLQGDTCYVAVLQKGLEPSSGEVGPLPNEIRSGFRTR